VLAEGNSPAAGREVLSDEDRRVERVLLELRLLEGVPLSVLDENGVAEAKVAVGDGFLTQSGFDGGRAVLTDEGRLLADGIVRRLLA
jgi:oxygen-independent coproporphyrinogen-3 oxidase